eukprot:11911566-Heterocapsa_arctica.AAC.1
MGRHRVRRRRGGCSDPPGPPQPSGVPARPLELPHDRPQRHGVCRAHERHAVQVRPEQRGVHLHHGHRATPLRHHLRARADGLHRLRLV